MLIVERSLGPDIGVHLNLEEFSVHEEDNRKAADHRAISKFLK